MTDCDQGMCLALSIAGFSLFLLSFVVNIVILTTRKQERCCGRVQTSIQYVQTTMRRHGPFKTEQQDAYTSIEEMMRQNKSPMERPYSSLKIQDSSCNRDTYLEPDVFNEIVRKKESSTPAEKPVPPAIPAHGPKKLIKMLKKESKKDKGFENSNDSSDEHDYECPPVNIS